MLVLVVPVVDMSTVEPQSLVFEFEVLPVAVADLDGVEAR